MPPKPGKDCYGLDGSQYRLSQEIGRGGQGSVWALAGEPNLVAKFYHEGIPPQDLKKLEAMCRLKTASLEKVTAWPLTLLRETKSGQPQALLMRRVKGFKSVNQLYSIKSRLRAFPEAQFPFLLHTAINTARAFATIHESGQVVGDVNHSNLMISQTATVAMIDCDSFQITDGSHTFVCPVGVPEFTAPELQGMAFSGQPRTEQHDAFGLSVLIFYLLFLGRHPFMGAYDPRADEMLALEKAIAEYKFPYALSETSPEVRLPPFVPRLSDYPAPISDGFKRAFTREGMTRKRPSAQEWVTALRSLASSTKQCSLNSNHQYYSGLNQCPWCRVEGVIGTAIFGVKLTAVRDDRFNLVAVWAEITSLEPSPEPLETLSPKVLSAQHTPDAAISPLLEKRRRFRTGSIGVVLVTSILAVSLLPKFLAIVAIVIALITGKGLWTKGAALTAPFQEAFKTAEAAFRAAEAALTKASLTPASYTQEKKRLSSDKKAFDELGPSKARRIKELEGSRERKQRQHFLEKFRIEDEKIPSIGPKNKMLLAAWNIEDAWDVEAGRLSQVKGFGPVKRKILLDWRFNKEQQFRFDPSQPVDPRDLHTIDQEFQAKSVALKKSLTAGPAVLRQAIGVWQAQRRQIVTELNVSANRLAQAQVNMEALRRF